MLSGTGILFYIGLATILFAALFLALTVKYASNIPLARRVCLVLNCEGVRPGDNVQAQLFFVTSEKEELTFNALISNIKTIWISDGAGGGSASSQEIPQLVTPIGMAEAIPNPNYKERVIDLVIPIAERSDLCGKDHKWVLQLIEEHPQKNRQKLFFTLPVKK